MKTPEEIWDSGSASEAFNAALREARRWRTVAEGLASELNVCRNALYFENEHARTIRGPAETPGDLELPFDYAIEPADEALAAFELAKKEMGT